MEQLAKMGRIIRWIVLAVVAVYFVSVLIGAGVYFFIDLNTSSIELVKTVFELSLWLSVPMMIILILMRAWRFVAASLVPVILFSIIYIPLLIPRSPDVPSDAAQLSIVTFNLQAASDGIPQIIRDIDADIVALQELSQAGADAVEILDEIYPYQVLHPQDDSNVGQGILSRYPIESDSYWEYLNVPHTLGNQRVEIDFNGTILVIYNVHPWPPLAWATGYNNESHLVVLQDIADRTFNEQLPLLLVGDFNMTDSFEEYNLLNGRFTDSYRVAGDGIGYTYPNYRYEPLPPMLRLDYIWHSDHFQSVESTVWTENGGSDHSPVISTIVLLNQTRSE